MPDEIPINGRIATRLVGLVEVSVGLALLIWYIKSVLDPMEASYNFRQFYFGYYYGTGVFRRVLIAGIYILMAAIMPIFLLYSTSDHGSFPLRKRLAVLWCIFRGFSFFYIIYLIYTNRYWDTVYYSLMAASLVFWGASIFIVTMFVSGLTDAMPKEINQNIHHHHHNQSRHHPPLRKKRVSAVTIVKAEEEDGSVTVAHLTEDHIRQLEEFRAYVHRTSWCSDRPISSTTLVSSNDSRF